MTLGAETPRELGGTQRNGGGRVGISRKRIVVLTDGVVAKNMSGTGIRYLEIARRLAEHFDVELGHATPAQLAGEPMEMFAWSPEEPASAMEAAGRADMALVHGFVLEQLPGLRQVASRLIVDLYCPFIFENIEIHRDRELPLDQRQAIHGNDLRVLCNQLLWGDYFLCCTDRQRDWALGMLTALGRLNPGSCTPGTVPEDFVGLVPFGLSEKPPIPGKNRVMKGVWPGIEEHDFVLLWGGGLWSWLDPLTVIRAMVKVSSVRPNVKLVFLSSKTAGPVITMPAMDRAAKLAEQCGLRGRSVIFNDKTYIEYDRRVDYFHEADIGICAHSATLEAHFAYRTRLLDYLNVGLPILTSAGDYFGDYVDVHELGRTLPIADSKAWADSILELAASDDTLRSYRKRSLAERDKFTWTRAVQPLIDYCSMTAPMPHTDSGTSAPQRQEPPPTVEMAFSQALEQVRLLGSNYAHLSHRLRGLQGKVDLVKSIPFAKTLWRVAASPLHKMSAKRTR